MNRPLYCVLMVAVAMLAVAGVFTPPAAAGAVVGACDGALPVQPVPLDGRRLNGLSIIEATRSGDHLCYRVQNWKVARWIDVYAEGIEHDGTVVDLGYRGSLGAPQNGIFWTPSDIVRLGSLWGEDYEWKDFEEDWNKRYISLFPSDEEPPDAIADVSRFRALRIRCFGLGFNNTEVLRKEDFPKFLLATAPTVLFKLMGAARKAPGVARGMKNPPAGPDLRGRPNVNPWRNFMKVVLEPLRNPNAPGNDGLHDLEALYSVYRTGDIEKFAWDLSKSLYNRVKTLYLADAKVVHDLLAHLGVPRKVLFSGKAVRGLNRLETLFDIAEVPVAITQMIGATFQDPVTEFEIPLTGRAPILFLFDTSGSMKKAGRMDSARQAALSAIESLESPTAGAGLDPAVGALAFGGSCARHGVTRTVFDFTTDLDRARHLIESGLPEPDGETPLPQAIEEAEREVERFVEGNSHAIKSQLVVLSDGQSSCGSVRPAGVYSKGLRPRSAPRRPDSLGYTTVGLDLEPGSAAERDLQYLADSRGGLYHSARDRRQLVRAFQRAVEAPSPKPRSVSSGLAPLERVAFLHGTAALVDGDARRAVKLFRELVELGGADAAGHFNLALARRARGDARAAADSLQRYLELAPDAPDRAEVEREIRLLHQDHLDHRAHQVAILRSDLEYLERYYESLFHRAKTDLAIELDGFVRERRDFYERLPEELGIEEPWLEQEAENLSAGFERIAARLGESTFDRDAVSLLTLPIGQLQEIVERLEERVGETR